MILLRPDMAIPVPFTDLPFTVKLLPLATDRLKAGKAAVLRTVVPLDEYVVFVSYKLEFVALTTVVTFVQEFVVLLNVLLVPSDAFRPMVIPLLELLLPAMFSVPLVCTMVPYSPTPILVLLVPVMLRIPLF